MIPIKNIFTDLKRNGRSSIFMFLTYTLLALTTLTYVAVSISHRSVFSPSIYYEREFEQENINKKCEKNTRISNSLSGVEVFLPNNASSSTPRCGIVSGRRFVVTYASHGWLVELARNNCQIAVSLPNIDACFVVNPGFLDIDFQTQNKHILKLQRGAGYWIWKPYIIFRFLTEIMQGEDVLFYLDADKILLRDFEDYICLQANVGQDVVVFYQGQVEYEWSKADALFLMNVQHMLKNVTRTMQIYGSFFMLRKSFNSLRFAGEWLTYVQDERIVTDKPSQIRDELDDFIENRHDQTVLSILAKRWNIPTWPSPLRSWNFEEKRTDSRGRPFASFNRFSAPAGLPTPSKPLITQTLSLP